MPLPPLSPALQAQHSLLSHLLTSLRRTRPHVPFWKLPAHRVPTLHLYRHLLRASPSPIVTQWLGYKWRYGRNQTGPRKSRKLLEEAERMLGVFVRAREGGEREGKMLEKYGGLIYARGKRNEWKTIELRELQRLQDLRNRPIVTGAVTLGSPHNKPFPMLKPQPQHISRMISWRQRARNRRMGAQQLYMEWKDWIRDEARAEWALGLQDEKGVYAGHETEWYEPINEQLKNIERMFEADTERQQAPLTPRQIATIRAARRERVRNLTYQRQRELRGEVTRRLAKTLLQGPPAPLIAQWGERERMEDRIVRGSGWGGYAGEVKARKGMRLRDKWTDRRWARERRKLGLGP
ncbi:hypothetical protein CALCODRAFT_164152 [Calocera cornea HHB12733]|uniref:Uncharacterized protein n=1 Tax=Calocera cornea HHB12733 TaxID=1353952 RepID=A0A165CIM6_9BASI|nr:hypothetical protein CALCODRAFT_164152 [Calocera cornea HHB12733]